MQPWFLDAKFGIFLHWGIYSAGHWNESWCFFNGEVSWEEYKAQAQEFTASAYDPDQWAALFAEAGAKYAVLTSKHHDGFSLWPTKLSSWNAAESSPAGRDVLGPYCEALRRHGLKVGIYFSHLDWSHPDYPSVLPKGSQPHDHAERHSNPFAYPQNGEDPEAWKRFLAFHRGQLREICDLYGPDLLWFDGDWERDPEQWGFAELREDLKTWLPDVILNSRMGGFGDYGTPEQAIPVYAPQGPWEFCVTMNDNWGYVARDKNHKTTRQCIRMLGECAGMGGNLLLDVGPRSDGTLIPEQSSVLKEMGQWTKKNASALYGTTQGLPPGLFYGSSTLSPDRRTLHLIAYDQPIESLAVKGLKNKVLSAEISGYGPVGFKAIGGAPWAGLPGILWVDVPAEAVDPLATVVTLTLDGPLDLYLGRGDAVTFNE